jgi:hypothetical protein
VKNLVSKPQIEIQSTDQNEHSTYRVREGYRVHHVTIHTSKFGKDTMCRPYLLIPRLPAFPGAEWATMRIS